MKVLFLAAYSELAASSRTRVYQFLPFLEKEGIKCKCICFVPKELNSLMVRQKSFFIKLAYRFLVFALRIVKILEVIILSSSYDIIFIQKIVFPLWSERILKIFNIYLVA